MNLSNRPLWFLFNIQIQNRCISLKSEFFSHTLSPTTELFSKIFQQSNFYSGKSKIYIFLNNGLHPHKSLKNLTREHFKWVSIKPSVSPVNPFNSLMYQAHSYIIVISEKNSFNILFWTISLIPWLFPGMVMFSSSEYIKAWLS